MNYLDIHTHILPAVDDGAKDVEASLALLEMLSEQGVTDVIATPHFYPDTDSADGFSECITSAYKRIKDAADRELPNIYIGCELHYFQGMGKSEAIKQFVIKGTNYLLLELPYMQAINKTVLQDIVDIREQLGIIPILAHIERYHRNAGFKKLLPLLDDGTALAQINAADVLDREYSRVCEKLIKHGYVSFLASDTHSVEHRPPLIDKAIEYITNRLGKSVATRLIINCNRLLDEIEGSNEK